MKIFLSIFSFIVICHCADELPDINDLFPIKTDYNTSSARRTVSEPNKLLIDVENIDLDKLKHKVDDLHIEMLRNDTRRNRRPFIMKNGKVWGRNFWGWMVPYDWERNAYGSWLYAYNQSTIHRVKVKVMDLMLQTLYMARHKIKFLQRHREFNTVDTQYRIAYLYRKMKNSRRDLQRIYKTMDDGYSDMTANRNWWIPIFYRCSVYIFLHQKAIKHHSDFNYYYRIAINLDEIFNKKHNITTAMPAFFANTTKAIRRRKTTKNIKG